MSHFDEEAARERFWSPRLHPEKIVSSEADEARARSLIAEGYFSTSNKYRMVARVNVPPAAEAFTFAPGVPKWLREEVKSRYEDWVRWGMRVHREGVDHLQLTVGEFLAFKRLGGRSA